MSLLEELFDALEALDDLQEGSKATSIRQPAALHRAAQIATDLGMDESLTAASNRALEERVRTFARQQALVAHFTRFPEDRPRLSAVALRRIHGSDHRLEGRPELVESVAQWIENREPAWAFVDVDGTVDQVLLTAEMLLDGVGDARAATA